MTTVKVRESNVFNTFHVETSRFKKFIAWVFGIQIYSCREMLITIRVSEGSLNIMDLVSDDAHREWIVSDKTSRDTYKLRSAEDVPYLLTDRTILSSLSVLGVLGNLNDAVELVEKLENAPKA